MAVYFPGRKLVGSFSKGAPSGRERLDWKVFEEWRDIDEGTTARCGRPGSCTVELDRGLSEKAMSTLKDVVGGSFGVKDIWSLKAEVEHVIGHEVNWHTSTKSTKTFNIQAPECGHSALTVYQLVRIFEITFFRKKWFTLSDDKWIKLSTRTFDEPTNKHDGIPDTVADDPMCGCPEPSVEPKYDGLLGLDFGRISVRVPYIVVPTGLEIQFTRQVVNVTTSDFPALLRGLDDGLDVNVSASLIPEPLLFLGEIADPILTGTAKKITNQDDSEDQAVQELSVPKSASRLSLRVRATAEQVVSAL